MYLTSTGTVVAQLTRKGRQILAENSAAFNITQFKFSDDEINYAFFDGSTVDAVNGDLSNWPVLEACTNGEYSAGQRYSVFSANNSLISLAAIDSDLGYMPGPDTQTRAATLDFFSAVGASNNNLGGAPFVSGKQEQRNERPAAPIFIEYDSATVGQEWSFMVKTLYGTDNAYLVSLGSADNKSFTVGGSYQTIVSAVPDTDPTTVTQNQSQGVITFKLAGDFITRNGIVYAPDGTTNPWAISQMSIVGQQTGQMFWVTLWLWSKSAVEKQKGTACPPGFHPINGVCEPNETPCPAGYHKDANGNCVSDTGGGCLPGYHKDANGNCVPDAGGGAGPKPPDGQDGTGYYTWVLSTTPPYIWVKSYFPTGTQWYNTCKNRWESVPPQQGCYDGRTRDLT